MQRRFRGDGKATDETDILAAEVGQRLAQWILSTTRFDEAMEGVRDDWLIAARGADSAAAYGNIGVASIAAAANACRTFSAADGLYLTSPYFISSHI